MICTLLTQIWEPQQKVKLFNFAHGKDVLLEMEANCLLINGSKNHSGFVMIFRTSMKLRCSRKKNQMVLFLFYRMLGDSVIVKPFTTAHYGKNFVVNMLSEYIPVSCVNLNLFS